MAGAGYKLFNTGDVLTAAQVNTYLQEQVVMVFANATARTTALSGVLAEGMVSYLKDTNATEVYDGSAWVGIGNSGDITGITTGATSGLTGGVTSGTADLKFNTTAKGGLLVGTGSGTVTELTVGSNNTILTADSSTASGLKWAAASSGAMTLISAQTFSNQASVTMDNIFSSTYDSYRIDLSWYAATRTDDMQIQVRVGTTPTTATTNYTGNLLVISSNGTQSNISMANTSQWTLSGDCGDSTNPSTGSLNLVRATSGTPRYLSGIVHNSDQGSGGFFSANRDNTTAVTGLLLKSSSSNITGYCKVYGLVAV